MATQCSHFMPLDCRDSFILTDQPPCNVDTKSTLSPALSSYSSSPSSSQSASLMSTRMPGRLIRSVSTPDHGKEHS